MLRDFLTWLYDGDAGGAEDRSPAAQFARSAESEESMEEELTKKIEEIISGMQCPKGFKCAKGGFEYLCKANDFGLEGYLDCLEEKLEQCIFALYFGFGHLCQCPLRVYLAKKLKK